MHDTKNFEYLLLVNNKLSLIYCEIKRVIYKIILNIISSQTNYTNRIICKLVDDTSKQIHFSFEKYLQKNIQSIQFKSVATIVL